MDSGACDFARRKESRNRGATVQIRLHSAHHVVGGRADRDAIARKVEPRAPAHLRDERKAFVNEISIQAFERQEHRLFCALALANNGARHAIARRQIACRLVSVHERLAKRVHQPRTFAAKRLRQQKSRLAFHHQRGGMELDKFQIDNRRACAVGHRDAVAGRHVRVRRLVVNLPGAASRKQHTPGARRRQPAIGGEEPGANAAAVLDHQINNSGVVVRPNIG